MNIEIKDMFTCLIPSLNKIPKYALLTQEDIARVVLASNIFSEIPGPALHDEWRNAKIKRYMGIEIWESDWINQSEYVILPSNVVFKLTGNTKHLWKNIGEGNE